MTEPEYLTVQEVADLLRVSSRLVYKLIAAGDLTHVRMGDVIRIPRSAIEEMAA